MSTQCQRNTASHIGSHIDAVVRRNGEERGQTSVFSYNLSFSRSGPVGELLKTTSNRPCENYWRIDCWLSILAILSVDHTQDQDHLKSDKFFKEQPVYLTNKTKMIV
jgi:hypothetical protein